MALARRCFVNLSLCFSIMDGEYSTNGGLYQQTADTITDWAIQLDLSSPYALSSGLSTIAFEINGEGLHWQGDMLLSIMFASSTTTAATDL